MFTGIVQGKATIKAINGSSKLKTFEIEFPQNSIKGVIQGASIAINGTCLTVTKFDTEKSLACFDVMKETLDKTNLNALKVGQFVNFERAAKFGDEIGGHLMSGHIYITTELSRIKKTSDQCTLFFKMPHDIRDYILPKGFIGLNGCSLTIGDVNNEEFNVHLIPETLRATTFGEIKEQAVVNIEIDPQTQAIVDTVKRVLASNDIKR